MKSLFEPVKISQLSLKNRVIRSATFEYSGDKEGRLTQELSNLYENLAKGGVGTIITGMIGVDGKSRLSPNMIKAYGGMFIQDYQKLPAMLHGYDCKIIAQIAHCGVKATSTDDGSAPVGPSDWAIPSSDPAKELSKNEIKEIIGNFADTAVACQKAGIDGVQIHGAHGYLLSQFLSPTFNKRDDEYGGSIENRARIVLEVYQAIREAVGPDYPVWIKINSTDRTEDGLTVDESLWVCKELDMLGIDAVEISGGIGISRDSVPVPRIKTEDDEGIFADNAIKIADEIKAPVICVGGFRTPSVVERILNQGQIAAISLSRSLISEPELINRWRSGSREKSRCISCNKCFAPKNGFGCQAFQD